MVLAWLFGASGNSFCVAVFVYLILVGVDSLVDFPFGGLLVLCAYVCCFVMLFELDAFWLRGLRV